MAEQFKRSTFTIVVTIFLFTCAIPAVSNAQAQTLPAPWRQADIGSPGVPGSAREINGSFLVDASGADIWGTADQFHFVYYGVSGDIDVRVAVNDIERAHHWTKGGVMIRETLAANSKHAMTVISAASGLAFQRRVATGGVSTHTGRTGSAPGWVRLVRTGNMFTSYISENGANWTLIGSETITMSASVYVGLALVSVDNTQLATASFSNVSVQVAPTQPGSQWSKKDVGAPAVAGRSSEASGTLSVTGAGTDVWDPSDQFHYMHKLVDGDVQIVARVSSVGNTNPKAKAGVMIREALTGTSPYAYMFGTASMGWAWRSRAVGNGASVHTPGSPAPCPGWVKLVRRGNTFSGYESTDGVNWTLLDTETIAMPSGVFVGVAVNSKDPRVATTGTFTDVSITIPDLPANLPPSSSITSPTGGSRFTAPATVTVNASAGDLDGTVAQVAFFANGQPIGTDTTAPFSVSWTNVAAGTYSLTARATDNQGASTTSAAVSMTVDPAEQHATDGVADLAGQRRDLHRPGDGGDDRVGVGQQRHRHPRRLLSGIDPARQRHDQSVCVHLDQRRRPAPTR